MEQQPKSEYEKILNAATASLKMLVNINAHEGLLVWLDGLVDQSSYLDPITGIINPERHMHVVEGQRMLARQILRMMKHK